MKNNKIALIPGSFDPPTNGHFELIKTASERFDKVYVTLFKNTAKSCMFSASQRALMLRAMCEGLENVVVDTSDEFLADYTRRLGIGTVVKGVRNTVDFEYEYAQATANADMDPGLSTIFIPAKPNDVYLSSTFIRMMIDFGRDIGTYVPESVKKIISDIKNNRGR